MPTRVDTLSQSDSAAADTTKKGEECIFSGFTYFHEVKYFIWNRGAIIRLSSTDWNAALR